MRKHKPLLMNWFKAKVTARKSYGFKNPEIQKIALYHGLGDLPVPEWTHRFG